MKRLPAALFVSALLLPPCSLADVSYTQTSRMTGGSMMGLAKMAGAFSSQAKQALAATTSTVMIHGSRMVQANPHSTEIIDLDAQTITSIDHDKRTYSVMTFQQMQQAMTDAAAKTTGAQPGSSNTSQMTFDAHISSTGATRELNGETAHETLLTITMVANSGDAAGKGGMAATSEWWLVKDAPGMDELRRFNERMVKELSMNLNASGMTSLLSSQPGGVQALAELQKESAKVNDGFPVLQVTRVGMTVDGQPLPAPSVAPLPQSDTQDSGNAETGKATAASLFGRALGSSSMGSMLGHHSSKPAPADPSTTTDPATAGVLMENQIETSGFSVAAVDTNSFEIPAGYKLVTSPLQQHK